MDSGYEIVSKILARLKVALDKVIYGKQSTFLEGKYFGFSSDGKRGH